MRGYLGCNADFCDHDGVGGLRYQGTWALGVRDNRIGYGVLESVMVGCLAMSKTDSKTRKQPRSGKNGYRR